MVTIFRKTEDDGTQETVFVVTLAEGGVLRVSGNKVAAEMLGIPTQPLRLLDGSFVDPKDDPYLYLKKLAVMYSGSRLRAEFVA